MAGGLKIGYVLTKANPATVLKDNASPRLGAAKLRATDMVFARLCAAEEHSFENAVFYFAGVLAAIQAGVSADVICE
jgi:uncharacterized MAPEG superfamily protein